jgi:hypothetical protein
VRRATVLVLLAIAAPACRQPMAIDTSGAKFIPAPVAVDNLRKLLPEAMVVGCTAPKAIFRQEEIKEWKIDAEAIEFHVEKQSPFRVAFAEITETRAEKLFGGFQVRLFTPASADPKKEHYSFNFRDEPPARRAAELIDALRVKK